MTVRTFIPYLPALLLALLSLGGLSSCGETALTRSTREHQEQYAAIDDDSIQSYLRTHKYTTYTRTNTGVYIVPVVKGTGTQAAIGKQVRVKYVGRIVTVNPVYLYTALTATPGNIFDNSSENHTPCGCAVFTVGTGLVAGFSEGLTYMRQGDRSLIIIPSQQAYGPAGSNGIYPDSTLLFDVELLEVGP